MRRAGSPARRSSFPVAPRCEGKGAKQSAICGELWPPDHGQDFADKRQRGAPITVSAARSFILNYYRGEEAAVGDFDKTETTPKLCKAGAIDPDWEALRKNKKIWKDAKLETAGKEFAALVQAQRKAFVAKKKGTVDFQEKVLNFAVLSAWAYTAGLLSANAVRLGRHFGLRSQGGTDPLNAGALVNGKHSTDSDTYRGLGYRTDAKERGRFVELFYLQAEKGNGITGPLIDVAIKKYHAKQGGA
jgi:hypothetical protein